MFGALRRRFRQVHPISWIILAAALILLNVFVFKLERVPIDREYTASWGNAQWIAVAGSHGASGYFRKTISLNGPPDDAYLLMQGSQSYSVYVNGNFLDKTRELFLGGHPDLANIYDLGALLREGQNTIAICALNYDQGSPTIRTQLHMTYGQAAETFASDSTWRATDDPRLVKQSCGLFGRTARSSGSPVWTQVNFADDRWPAAAYSAGVRTATLPINPQTYAMTFPKTWAIAGASDDTFFRSSVNLPAPDEAWLRLASSGIAEIYLNGHLALETPARIGTDRTNPTPRAASVTAGVFNVTPYLHPGENEIAVHVTTLSSRSKGNDPKSRPAALCADLLAGSGSGALQPTVPIWEVSTDFSPGWANGSDGGSWQPAVAMASDVFSVRPPYKVIATSLEKLDLVLTVTPILLTTVLFLIGCAIAVALQTLKFPWRSGGGLDSPLVGEGRGGGFAYPIDRVALAFIPTVALGVLLLGLKLEPLIPRPFPYTPAWLAALAGIPVVVFTVMLLASVKSPLASGSSSASPSLLAGSSSPSPLWGGLGRGYQRLQPLLIPLTLVALVLLAAYMVTYQLTYESYWQDELSSIYAAIGVINSGVPHLASGFIYPKGELFSYLLAGFIAIFGQDAAGPRILSVLEYLVSLPLTFFVGRYFFGRRVGLLATALMVFSPLALLWARSARMYQQVELAVLIVLYLFYRACLPGARKRYIYGSMAAVVAMYLSHEESFIVLPAIAAYFLATQRLRWIRNVHWWIAGLTASSVILGQLLLTVVTHPAALGNDPTQRPMVFWTPENFDFYMPLLLDGQRVMAHAFQFGWTSVLALIVCIAALFVRDRALRYVSVFFAVPLLVLIFGFSLNSDRYLYPLFPPLMLLAALAVVRAADAISWATLRVQVPALARGVIVAGFAALSIAAVLQAQMTPLTYFGLATSRLLGLDYHHRYPDYQAAGSYIRDHWQAGDTLITVAPSIEGIYYAEQPDYMIYQGKALYLYEKNDHIVDTLGGAIAILNGRDLAAVLSSRHRVWLLSTSYYRATLPKGFQPVFEGQQTLVYLRDGVNSPSLADSVPFVPVTPGA